MAERDVRIRRLEYAQHELRLRRARLEVILLESEMAAMDRRMAESIAMKESLLLASSLVPSTTGTSSLRLEGAPSPSLYSQGSPSSVTASHRSVSKSPYLGRPEEVARMRT